MLARGTELGPGQLAAAAAAGYGSVPCARRPRVALVCTGDELVPPGAPLAPGQIHNTNEVTLAALTCRAGGVVERSVVVGDDPAATSAALAGALEKADVTVVAGGVSVGRHDHVKGALAALGVQERFWRVALKPGKPIWFGTLAERLVFGLPGNPVSAFVCFRLFVAPALRALQRAEPLGPPLAARLAEPVRRSPDREQAVRVRLHSPHGELVAWPTGPQGSHLTSSLAAADGLAIVARGEGTLEAGATVAVERL